VAVTGIEELTNVVGTHTALLWQLSSLYPVIGNPPVLVGATNEKLNVKSEVVTAKSRGAVATADAFVEAVAHEPTPIAVTAAMRKTMA
jgi:hypothetical protein